MSQSPILFPLEIINEYDVAQIALNGTELLKNPLDPLENFEYIANNIDFNETSDEDNEMGHPSKEANEKASSTIITQENSAALMTVHNEKAMSGIRCALNEVCALIDILTVAKDRNYLLMEPIHLDAPDPRLSLLLSGKKTSINHAADILLKGSENLLHKYGQLSDIRRRNNTPSFHEQLLNLRRYWRLRPAGQLIVGDYGLSAIGSTYRFNANFEVKESTQPGAVSPLLVSLQPDQRVSARLRICITDTQQSPHLIARLSDVIYQGCDDDDLQDHHNNSHHIFADFTVPTTPHEMLLEARNSLIARELFHRLTTEATQMSPDFPVLLFCNKIVCTAHADVQIYICLEEKYWDSAKKEGATEANVVQQEVLPPTPSGCAAAVSSTTSFSQDFPEAKIFSLYLRRLLLSNLKRNTLRNLSAVVHTPNTRVNVENRDYFISLIHLARHLSLRGQVLSLLDGFAASSADPIVTVLSVRLSSLLESRIRVRIVSRGYEGYRGFGSGCSLSISVHSSMGITAISSDARVMEFGFNARHLIDWFGLMTTNHVISLLKTLSKESPWHLLAYSGSCPYGPIEVGGNGSLSVCLLQSHDQRRMVCIRCGPESGVRMFVSTDVRPGDVDAVMDSLAQLPDMPSFREVNLKAVRGSSVVQKMEMLLAVLSSV